MRALRGLAGGFVGAAAAHLFVTGCLRAGGEDWLKGPYGPHFFGISGYLGILYGGIALALAWRAKPALLGLLGNFLGIALPMVVLTHWATPMRALLEALGRCPVLAGRLMIWMGVFDPVGLIWTLAVIAVYLVANWGTTLALGAVLCPKRRWLGALAAAAGALGGYFTLKLFQSVVPALAQGRWDPRSFVPSPMDLLTGALTGAGIGLGLALVERFRAPGGTAQTS